MRLKINDTQNEANVKKDKEEADGTMIEMLTTASE